jgi:Concanavalin A-like lectin/glucanases superfamily
MGMRVIRAMMLWCMVFALAATCFAQDLPWQKEYTGKEAVGKNIIGLWQFDGPKGGKDASGNGHDLVLRGKSGYVKGGKFGNGLQSFLSGDPKNNKKHGAMVKKDAPELNPKGAFTLELWFKGDKELLDAKSAFLIDKKYYHYAKDIPKANTGYCLVLNRSGKAKRKIMASLGFGKDSAFIYSDPVTIDPGVWYHLALTYNGKGIVRIFLDGKPINKTVLKGRGPVAANNYRLTIGDRYGSTHFGFPGIIDQVRLVNGVSGAFSVGMGVDVRGGRTVFMRMEKGKTFDVIVDNESPNAVRDVKAVVQFKNAQAQLIKVGPLKSGEGKAIKVPIDTTLRPDAYPYTVTVTGVLLGRKVVAEKTGVMTIVARPMPKRMPVIMWGGGDVKRLKEIGFTHTLHTYVDYNRIWKAGKPTDAASEAQVARYRVRLDELFANGIGAAIHLYPARWIMRSDAMREKYQRINRNDDPALRNGVSASHPDLVKFCYNAGASVARSYGDHPGLQGSLIHSEVRGTTELDFQPWFQAQWKAYSGIDIPAKAVSKRGVKYDTLENFPPNRIVPDDYPLLKFYRWFWGKGDGWNELHTQVHKGLKSTGRDDIITWYDPAVRVPSRWDSGGGVDVVSQWTYTYPDPIKIGVATDELFAMAEGRPGQKVMKMTQVIWYRSQTAPKLPKDKSRYAQWEKDIPDARFITISPDFMREALWIKMSRPVQGIMYHGWASLVEGGGHGKYRYTNPKSKFVLGELVRSVVRPLGPALMQVPEPRRKVALLQSFASQMFASRGAWGWSGKWDSDAHLVCQWAQIQPRIVYEETIDRSGLDGIEVLVMPHCDVLPESVYKKIEAFQKRGGIIVADEHLAPALKPDILLNAYKRVGKPDVDKKHLQSLARKLRKELAKKHTWFADSSSQDIVVRRRHYGEADYLFAVNDKRTYGAYIGHHRKVMEKGLPNNATLSVQRRGVVYDLVKHKRVTTKLTAKGIAWNAQFGPGAGKVFLIMDKRVGKVKVAGPGTLTRGTVGVISVSVLDTVGNAPSAMLPVQVEILDPKGRPAEGSGYYGAKNGVVEITLATASNDLRGIWKIRATDLASGKVGKSTFRVR